VGAAEYVPAMPNTIFNIGRKAHITTNREQKQLHQNKIQDQGPLDAIRKKIETGSTNLREVSHQNALSIFKFVTD